MIQDVVRPYALLSIFVLFACGSEGGFRPDPDAGTVGSNCDAQSANMTFFFTKNGTESGNLGGLAGADAICNAAATASGSSRTGWVAYLSALNDRSFGRVDARDRIGSGPWFNYCGDSIGDLDAIHGAAGIATGLQIAEDGFVVRFESPGIFDNAHDVFTGSDTDGRLLGGNGPDDPPQTCADWTSGSPTDTAFVGHVTGEWNSEHPTEGCNRTNLINTRAIGRIYCFNPN